MGTPDQERYQQYLCSREWSEKREAVRHRSGDKCERCRINPMEACHHLTYIRKYNERLEDLQASCNECHEFTHGKIQHDNRYIPWKIYLAGKVSKNCYRVSQIGLPRSLGAFDHDESWRVFKSAISLKLPNLAPDYYFDYCGPFFVAIKGHGEDAIGGHGDDTHGRALIECDDSTHVWSSNGTQPDTFAKCVAAVASCDFFFAYIESADCFGTLVEIGMAHALGKPIFIGISEEFEADSDLWFALECGDVRYGTAKETLAESLAWHLRGKPRKSISKPVISTYAPFTR